MPAQDKTDLLAIALDKRVAAVEHKLDTLEKLIHALGDAVKAVPALEAKIKALEDTKQDKKDVAAVAQKLNAQLTKQAQDYANQQVKDLQLEARLLAVENTARQALAVHGGK